MKQPLPKKWSRRIFAVRLGATLLGGAVLVVFLALLAMLYWMNAKAELTRPDKLTCPDVTVAEVRFTVRTGRYRVMPVEAFLAMTRGMPEPAANLVAKGLRDPSCPAVIVLSRTSGGEGVMAVSLGKYPGMFRLVRRDLERRAEKRLLPYAIKYHSGAPIFFTEGKDASGLMPLTVKGTTFVQASSTAMLERILDRINGPDRPPRPDPPGTWCDLQAESWPLLTQLAGDFSPEWGEALERMEREMPALGRVGGILCYGGAGGGRGDLYLDAASPEDAAEIARDLPEWIHNNPKIGTAILPVDKVEAKGKGVRIYLTVSP